MSDSSQAIISKTIKSNKEALMLISIIDPVWIDDERDSAVIATIIDLSTNDRPITPKTISNRIAGVVGLENANKLFSSSDDVEKYVLSCNDVEGSVDSHAQQIKLDYVKRSITNAAKVIVDRLPTYSSAEDAASGSVEIIAANVDPTIGESGAYTAEDSVDSWIKANKERCRKEWEWIFPTWNRRALFKQSQIVVFAAPSESGKSWYGMGMLEKICRAGDNVAVFSGEMTPPELIDRLVNMKDSSTHDINKKLEEIRSWSFTIYDGLITIDKIRAAVVRARAMGKPYDVVIVDHIHLMEFSGKDGYRVALNKAMSSFKSEIANQEGCGVILLAQLRKPSDNESSRRPRKSDIRESAAIENIADWIFLMAKCNEDDVDSTMVTIWCDKRRGGRGRMPTITAEISSSRDRMIEIDNMLIGSV